VNALFPPDGTCHYRLGYAKLTETTQHRVEGGPTALDCRRSAMVNSDQTRIEQNESALPLIADMRADMDL
jgi:hypothetical protein